MEKFDEIFDDVVSMLPRPARFGVVIMWLLIAIVISKQFVLSLLLAYNEWSVRNAVVAMIMTLLLAGLVVFAVYWRTYWREKSDPRKTIGSFKLLKFD